VRLRSLQATVRQALAGVSVVWSTLESTVTGLSLCVSLCVSVCLCVSTGNCETGTGRCICRVEYAGVNCDRSLSLCLSLCLSVCLSVCTFLHLLSN